MSLRQLYFGEYFNNDISNINNDTEINFNYKNENIYHIRIINIFDDSGKYSEFKKNMEKYIEKYMHNYNFGDRYHDRINKKKYSN